MISITAGISFLILASLRGMRSLTLVNPEEVRDRIVNEVRGLIANLIPKTNNASTAFRGILR
jgi:hypothetical protein